MPPRWDEDAHSLAAFVAKFSKPSLSITESEKDQISRIAVLVEQVTRAEGEDCLRNSGDLPVAVSYYSDGTPSFSWKRRTYRISPTKVVTRQGGRGVEMFLLRLYVRVGDEPPVPVLCLPRGMDRHTHAELFTAHAEAFSWPHTLKAAGILLMTFHMDRGGAGSLRRLLIGVIDKYCASLGDSMQDKVRSWSQWWVDFPCTNHDMHTSWGHALQELYDILGITNKKPLQKCVYVAVRSFRESYDFIAENLPLWITRVLELNDDECNYEENLEWWSVLRADAEMGDWLARLNVSFRNGRLRARRIVVEAEGGYDKLVGCIMYIFKPSKYSESRHACAGTVCMTLLGSVDLGLDSIVKYVLDSDDSGDWYLRQWLKFDQPCRSTY